MVSNYCRGFAPLWKPLLTGSKNGVEQHTAITIPWKAAKLALYYLGTHVAAHLRKITIPDEVLPPEPPSPPREYNPVFLKLFEKFKEMRSDFLKNV